MTESAHVAEYMKIRRYVLSLAVKAREKSVQIPTTMELSRKFGVSRQTVGKAMKELTRDGYIIGRPGIGSFTNPKRIEGSQSACALSIPTIGIVISDGMLIHLDEYQAKTLSAVLKLLPEMPAYVRLLNLSSSNAEIICKDLENEKLDGLFWIGARRSHEPVIRELSARRFPLVVNSVYDSGFADRVEFDFEQAGYDCAALLMKQNKTGIVFLGDTPPWNIPAVGIRRAFREAGVPLNEKLFLPRSGETLTQFRSLLNFGYPVDAVYNPIFLYTEIRDILRETESDCSLIANQLAVSHDPAFHGMVLHLDFERLAAEMVRLLKARLAHPAASPEKVLIPIECTILEQKKQEGGLL